MPDLLPILRPLLQNESNGYAISYSRLRQLIIQHTSNRDPSSLEPSIYTNPYGHPLLRLADSFHAADTNDDGVLDATEVNALAARAGGTNTLDVDDIDHLLNATNPSSTPNPINSYLSSSGSGHFQSYISPAFRGSENAVRRTYNGTTSTVNIPHVNLGTVAINSTHSLTAFIGRDNRLHLLVHPTNCANDSLIEEYVIDLGPTGQLGRFEEFALRNSDTTGGFRLVIDGRAAGNTNTSIKEIPLESGGTYTASALPNIMFGTLNLTNNVLPSPFLSGQDSRRIFLSWLRNTFFNPQGNFTMPTGPNANLLDGLVQYRRGRGAQALAFAQFVPITERPQAAGIGVLNSELGDPFNDYITQAFPASGGFTVTQPTMSRGSHTVNTAFGPAPGFACRVIKVREGSNEYYVILTLREFRNGDRTEFSFTEHRIPVNNFNSFVGRVFGYNAEGRNINEIQRFIATNFRNIFHGPADFGGYVARQNGFATYGEISGMQFRSASGNTIAAAITACRGQTLRAPTNPTFTPTAPANITRTQQNANIFDAIYSQIPENFRTGTVEIATVFQDGKYTSIILTSRGLYIVCVSTQGGGQTGDVRAAAGTEVRFNNTSLQAFFNSPAARAIGLTSLTPEIWNRLNDSEKTYIRNILVPLLLRNIQFTVTAAPTSPTAVANRGG